jgi:hypothetical protein
LLLKLVLAGLLLLGSSRNIFKIRKISKWAILPSSLPMTRGLLSIVFYLEKLQVTKFINSIIPSTASTQTVRNTLKAANLKAVTKKKKPLLSPVHRKKRLAFALKHQHWTVEDWKRVIWSDETKINRMGSDGQEYVWKRAGEPLGEREVKGTLKFGGGNLMCGAVWDGMEWEFCVRWSGG